MKTHGLPLLAATLAASFSAHGVDLMSPKALVTLTDGAAKVTSVGTFPNGGFVAMLQSGGTSPKVLFQHFDKLGARVGADTPVRVGVGTRLGGQVGVADNGDFVTAWYAGSPDDGVSARVFAANGTAKTAPIAVAASGGNATLAVAPNGDFVVAWNTSAEGTPIFVRAFAADGTPKTDAIRVADTVNPIAAFDVAIAENGDFTVAFEGFTPTELDPLYGQGIYLRRFADDGTPKASNSLVFKDDFAASHEPAIAATRDGDLMLVWTREAYGPEEPEQVQARCYEADGQAKTDMFGLNAYQYGPRDNADVTVSSGSFVAVWQASGQSPVKASVIGRRVSASTCAVTSTEFIATPIANFNQTQPAVSVNPLGDAVIAWNANNHPASARLYQHAPGRPTVTLLKATEDIVEGARVRLTAQLSRALDAPVSVDVTLGGTADQGDDFKVFGAAVEKVTRTRYRLTFPAGARTASLTLSALTDAEDDPGEYVTFTLDMDSAPTLAPGPGILHATGIF